MKTAEEYSNDVMKSWSEFDWDEINFNQFKNYVKNYIEQAQKEAYNQALEDALQSAEIEACNDYQGAAFGYLRISEQSILKLRK